MRFGHGCGDRRLRSLGVGRGGCLRLRGLGAVGGRRTVRVGDVVDDALALGGGDRQRLLGVVLVARHLLAPPDQLVLEGLLVLARVDEPVALAVVGGALGLQLGAVAVESLPGLLLLLDLDAQAAEFVLLVAQLVLELVKGFLLHGPCRELVGTGGRVPVGLDARQARRHIPIALASFFRLRHEVVVSVLVLVVPVLVLEDSLCEFV